MEFVLCLKYAVNKYSIFFFIHNIFIEICAFVMLKNIEYRYLIPLALVKRMYYTTICCKSILIRLTVKKENNTLDL